MNFGYGLLRETQVLTHLETGDQLGMDWTAIMLEGTFGLLDEAQKIQVKENPNLLLEATIKRYREEIYLRKTTKQP